MKEASLKATKPDCVVRRLLSAELGKPHGTSPLDRIQGELLAVKPSDGRDLHHLFLGLENGVVSLLLMLVGGN